MTPDFSPDEFLGPEGRLSRVMPGYEHRPQQSAMAAEIWRALSNRGRVAIEAGTGVGKSLAYLLPAASWTQQNRKRVVVSTYTRLLQTQLVNQDIPILNRVLGKPVRAAVAFGQDNYVCRFRLEMHVARGLFDTRDEAGAADRLMDWTNRTADGVVLNCPTPVPPGLQRRITRDSAACRGSACPYCKTCFYHTARQTWERSDLLIVNHSLFFAGTTGPADLLPEREAVIFDEAHRIEEVCCRHFGFEVSQSQLAELLDRIAAPGRKGLLYLLPAQSTARRTLESEALLGRSESDALFDKTRSLLQPGATRRRLHEPLETAAAAATLDRLSKVLAEIASDVDDELASAELAATGRRLQTTVEALTGFNRLDTDHAVYWAERSGSGRLQLSSAPLNVAPLLRAAVYDNLASTVMTSATLTVASDFDFFRRRLGLDDFATVRLDSPFDYATNSLLYVPNHMPSPNHGDEYARAAAKEIHRILGLTRGRALVLFTSYDMMNAVVALMPAADYAYLCQGDASVAQLLDRFRSDTHSVLFATQSFWQGVDVPGEALSCLIICRLPFEVPDDPRLEAIAERLKAEGLSPFGQYQVPTAVLRFRQGFGRLIRTARDRGVVCVLDRRIITQPYGHLFLDSLPRGLRVTTKPSHIAAFFADAPESVTP
jgi:ATP-dependent DNA helicase DinG